MPYWIVEEVTPDGQRHYGGGFTAADQGEAAKFLAEQYAPFRGGRLEVRLADEDEEADEDVDADGLPITVTDEGRAFGPHGKPTKDW